MSNLDRRRFVQLATAGSAALVGMNSFPLVAEAAAPKVVGGTDLSGWTTVVGDGVWHGPNATPVAPSDLAATHLGSHSTLGANVNRRGIMAHNLTYTRVSGLETLDGIQTADAEFRLPELPTTSNWDYNAQSLEAGLFVWDGADTRLDYGMAIQWLLNPWLPNFGAIRAWHQVDGEPEWVEVSYLEPDTEWHSLQFSFCATTGLSKLKLDGRQIDVDESLTVKHDHWGDTIDGRFQLELISVWPGEHDEVPAHSAEFRNWSWRQP